MSLGGIAIAIGAMVDAAIIMIENAHKHIEREAAKPSGERREHWQVILDASKEVGPSLFYSLLVITVSFVPVFTLEAQEGRLFRPLAFTKTYAMAAAAALSVTVVPILMGYWIRGRILPEERNPINRFLIRVYHPVNGAGLFAEEIDPSAVPRSVDLRGLPLVGELDAVRPAVTVLVHLLPQLFLELHELLLRHVALVLLVHHLHALFGVHLHELGHRAGHLAHVLLVLRILRRTRGERTDGQSDNGCGHRHREKNGTSHEHGNASVSGYGMYERRRHYSSALRRDAPAWGSARALLPVIATLIVKPFRSH
jgi:hypothetical protein